jgi:hypothetical protein
MIIQSIKLHMLSLGLIRGVDRLSQSGRTMSRPCACPTRVVSVVLYVVFELGWDVVESSCNTVTKIMMI